LSTIRHRQGIRFLVTMARNPNQQKDSRQSNQKVNNSAPGPPNFSTMGTGGWPSRSLQEIRF
jgi:hypothetical protein